MTAKRTQENLCTTILVKEYDAGIKPLRLRQQEIEDDGFAGSRRSDQKKIAKIAMMKIEMIWRCSSRLQNGDGRAPQIAGRLPHRLIMAAGKPCKIRR